MAKKQTGPGFRDIIIDIKKKKFASVYLLMGEESYYLDEIAERLENNVVDEADRDFNNEIYYGSDCDVSLVSASAQQFPVMAARKLVMLREAQSIVRAKVALEKLAPYVSNPNSSTVLVVIFKGDNLNATSELMKAAAASGSAVVFKSPKLRDYELLGPLRDYCNELGIGIDDKAVNILCEYIGSPLSKLFKEVDKLRVAIGERSRITTQDIEDNIGISKDFNLFELRSALAVKDYPKSMRILKYFRNNPKNNPTVMASTSLFEYFSKLCIALFSADKSDSSLIEQLDLKNSFALKDFRSGMNFYNAAQAVKAVHAIREFDAKSKGVESNQNEYDLLDELIFKIVT